MNFTLNSIMQFFLFSANLLTTKFCPQNPLENSEIVEIENGKLLGQYHNNYIAFKSIPYAEPPIGENRFESPIAYSRKWEGIRDARNYTHKMCQQSFGNDVVGDENCLYLNIFMPKIKSDKLYPVMFFIHGGSFNFGSGTEYQEKNIVNSGKFVYVSINYRLGAFGFLSTQDNEISGNMGLKDQRLALKWVKKNIRIFNGNPNMILLCGWSAGGASVHYHLLSKETESLAKAAISFSGTALNSWAFDNSPVEKLHKLAKLLNCPIESTKLIKNCLKNVPATNITYNSIDLITVPFNFPAKGFTPVIESYDVKDRFIDDYPENKIRQSNIANISWLVTHTAEEAAYYAPFLLTNLSTINNVFNSVLPVLLYFDDNKMYEKEDHMKMIADLKVKYNIPENITGKDYYNLEKLFSDEQITRGIQESVRLHQEYGTAPIYMYIFDYPLEYGYGNLITNRTDMIFGTGHGSDMQLIFDILGNNDYKDEYSNKILKNILNMLEQFIKTDVPIYDDIKLPRNLGKSDVIKYLNIGKNVFCIKSKKVNLN